MNFYILLLMGSRKLQNYLYASVVYAGFPGTAEDMIETPLDLNEYVIKHPAATYFVRVVGDSMEGAGIVPMDILVVDRSLKPSKGDVVVASVNGEFTVKRYIPLQELVILRSENRKYGDIQVDEGDDLQIWGGGHTRSASFKVSLLSKLYYGLIDCNNFFASCEKSFRPELRNRPVIVLSNNDGCVVARSAEAKALGIPMGTPLFKIRQLVEDKGISVFSSNFTLYSDMSRRVTDIARQNVRDLEVYSIDEAFFTLEGMDSLRAYQKMIDLRREILECTGIPVSIGFAKTKTLAKIACELCKKDQMGIGVSELISTDKILLDDLLRSIELEDIWGINRRLGAKLRGRKIENAYDLANCDGQALRRHTNVMVYRTHLELRGMPYFTLSTLPPAKKTIASTRSFGRSIKDRPQMKEAIAKYVAIACEKLRRQRSVASSIYIFIHTNPFSKKGPFYSNGCVVNLAQPSADTRDLLKAALLGLERIFLEGYEYKKSGVILSNITPVTNLQYSLFGWEEKRKHSERSMSAVDRVNHIWGNSTLRLGAEGFRQSWQMKRNLLSKRYTTSWDELLTVS